MRGNDNTSLPNEEWRAIPGFEGIYDVSNLGRIKRVGKAAVRGKGRGGGALVGHIRKPQRITGGYLMVQLWRDGEQFPILVHRAVAAAFIGPLPDGKEVNHLDGDKKNNADGNLEYVTRSENNKHAYATGLREVTEKQKAAFARRRKPRAMIECGCGCGVQIESLDKKGRPRRFLPGHYTKLLRRQQKGLSNE